MTVEVGGLNSQAYTKILLPPDKVTLSSNYNTGEGKQIFVNLNLLSQPVEAMIDTGAGISIIDSRVLKPDYLSKLSYAYSLKSVTGDTLTAMGRTRIDLKIGLVTIRFMILVVVGLPRPMMIIGNDVLHSILSHKKSNFSWHLQLINLMGITTIPWHYKGQDFITTEADVEILVPSNIISENEEQPSVHQLGVGCESTVVANAVSNNSPSTTKKGSSCTKEREEEMNSEESNKVPINKSNSSAGLEKEKQMGFTGGDEVHLQEPEFMCKRRDS